MYSHPVLENASDVDVSERDFSGRVNDLPDPVYRQAYGISKSGLDLVAESPARYEYVELQGNRDEPTPQMRLGLAIDCAVLTPWLFDQEYVVSPEGVRRNSKAWDEFEVTAKGKTILKPDELATVLGVRDSVARHPVASKLFSGGKPQVSYFWTDPLTRLKSKARADYVRPDGIIVDLKSTVAGGAKLDTFQRTSYSFRYHVQAAYYSDGANLCGEKVRAFLFVVVEREPPYHVAVFAIDEAFAELGRVTYERDLDTYARCKEFNQWPGYEPIIQPLSMPAWAK